jgi:hypothetical protein
MLSATLPNSIGILERRTDIALSLSSIYNLIFSLGAKSARDSVSLCLVASQPSNTVRIAGAFFVSVPRKAN